MKFTNRINLINRIKSLFGTRQGSNNHFKYFMAIQMHFFPLFMEKIHVQIKLLYGDWYLEIV